MVDDEELVPLLSGSKQAFARQQSDMRNAAIEAKALAEELKLRKRDKLQQVASSVAERKLAEQARVAERRQVVLQLQETRRNSLYQKRGAVCTETPEECREVKKARLRVSLSEGAATVAERQAKQVALVSERNKDAARRLASAEKATEEAFKLAEKVKFQKRDDLEQASASVAEKKAAQRALIVERKRAVVRERDAKIRARESDRLAVENKRKGYCIEKPEYCQQSSS